MINLALFGKELRENRIKFYIIFFILAVIAVVIPLIFEPARDFFDKITLPGQLQRELQFIGSNYNNYAWSQWTAKNLAQLGTIAAIIFGMGALAGEISYGTALFLASKPVSPREIYTTKAAAGLMLLAFCIFGSTLLLMLVTGWKGFELDYADFMVASLITFAGVAVIYLGTLIFSALIADPLKAGVVAALFWVIASLPGYFNATAVLSIFYQMKAVPFWLFGQSPIVPLGLALVTSGILYEAGVALWSRREY